MTLKGQKRTEWKVTIRIEFYVLKFLKFTPYKHQLYAIREQIWLHHVTHVIAIIRNV